jgi:ketosteroid isomerase-like protein
MTSTAAGTDTAVEVITRFESRFTGTMDVDAIMAEMTDDCVFEHVAPAAVGFGRHEGQAAVRAVWESMDEHFPGFEFEFEDIFGAGDRGVCRWTLRWRQPDGTPALIRGADVIRLRDGKIAEKLMYATA